MSVEQEHPRSVRAHAGPVYRAHGRGGASGTAAKLARSLRAAGCRVELGLEGKLKRSLELANKMGARFALIIGDNEIAAGEYALKNMQSGEQADHA